MGNFARFPLRRADTQGAGTYAKICDTRLGCVGIGTNNLNPRNLEDAHVSVGGSLTHPDWQPSTAYNVDPDRRNNPIRVANGITWVLHTNQPSNLTVFPGYTYWYETRRMPYFRNMWADVTKTSNTANADASKAILNSLIAAGEFINLCHYVYLPGAYKTGDTGGIAAATWLDTNEGWFYTDGETKKSYTKTVDADSTTSTIQLADTTNLTVGMHVWGTGLDENKEATIASILSGPARITVEQDQQSYLSPDTVTGINVTNGQTLNFSNQWSELRTWSPSTNNSRQVSPAVVARRLDSSGKNWAQWFGNQMRVNSTFTGWPIRGLAIDNNNPLETYTFAKGDYFESAGAYEIVAQFYGRGHHRVGVRESCQESLARAAIQQGWITIWNGLRESGWKMVANSGTSRPALWDNKIESVYMEGWGSWYSLESGEDIRGWKQGLLNASRFKLAQTCKNRSAWWQWTMYDDEDGSGETGARPRSQPFHRDIMFGLCTVLLTDALFLWRAVSTEPLGATNKDFPTEVNGRFYVAEMGLAIGVPVEAPPAHDDVAMAAAGFWTRLYQRALVVVRPKSGTKDNWGSQGSANYTAPFDLRELTGTLNPEDQGRLIKAGDPISFPPRSARIFWRVL